MYFGASKTDFLIYYTSIKVVVSSFCLGKVMADIVALDHEAV